MKTLTVRLVSEDGDELESIPVSAFVIAESWDDISPVESEDSILEAVESLYASLLTLLRERQAQPSHGCLWLKLALGEALLTADETPGDAVVISVPVCPLPPGDSDGFDDSY